MNKPDSVVHYTRQPIRLQFIAEAEQSVGFRLVGTVLLSRILESSSGLLDVLSNALCSVASRQRKRQKKQRGNNRQTSGELVCSQIHGILNSRVCKTLPSRARLEPDIERLQRLAAAAGNQAVDQPNKKDDQENKEQHPRDRHGTTSDSSESE